MSISRKKKVININKDILSLFDAARLMDTTKEIITNYIRNNELVYITEIKSLTGSYYIFKRDLIEFAHKNGLEIYDKYKKRYKDIFTNYPNELGVEYIQEIFDIKKIGLAFYIMENNPDMGTKTILYNNKMIVDKNDLIKFLWYHRRVMYNDTEYYPSLIEYLSPYNLFNENIDIPNARKIIQPFKFVKPDDKKEYLSKLNLKE